jgi:hypothetical protein
METKLSDAQGDSYRVYFLDSGNRITGVDELDCTTDEGARRLVRELGYSGATELWCGARLVARADRGGELTPSLVPETREPR